MHVILEEVHAGVGGSGTETESSPVTSSPFSLYLDSGNPAPVVDRETGKIILAFCQDNKKVFTLQSSDDGLTWGGMMDITAVANGGDWGFVGTGPPGGIQLPSGRLIIGVGLQ